MDDSTLGSAGNGDLTGPVPSCFEAMCVGGEVNGVCWMGVEQEGNRWVDLVLVPGFGPYS